MSSRFSAWLAVVAAAIFVCITTSHAQTNDDGESQNSSPSATQSAAKAKTPSLGSTSKEVTVKPAPDPLQVRLFLGDGREQWHPTRAQVGATTTDNGATYSVDVSQAEAYLSRIKPYVDRAPVNARIVLGNRATWNPLAVRSSSYPVPVKILPSLPGAILDVNSSAVAIKSSLESSPNERHIILVTKNTEAKITAAKFAGIDARIAHFVTHFNPGEEGRTQTVRRAISLIDGKMVAPGDIFSVNQAVGERTKARGFGEGIVFVDGHLDTQLGGGMCQVATTLYNAVLLANLKVVERHQHVRTVPYVKPGQDATVYWGQKDFRFQNSSQEPILIVYKTTGSHAICDIYGKANPNIRVALDDSYQRLGPRQYKAKLERLISAEGKTRVDYVSFSDYKWTPKLDYTF